jgi:hypothetical protein
VGGTKVIKIKDPLNPLHFIYVCTPPAAVNEITVSLSARVTQLDENKKNKKTRDDV